MMKEVAGADVAYVKLVSRLSGRPLSEDQVGLYAVAARFPHNLAGRVPWQQCQAGVYDCGWGTDTIRVVVAGELPREPHNAPLHLFSASPDLVDFGRSSYRRRSENTSALLVELFGRLQGEGFAMSFTMEDFRRQFVKEHFAELTAKEREELLQAIPPEERLAGLPPEQRLAGLSEEQIRQYLEQLTAGPAAAQAAPQEVIGPRSSQYRRRRLP
ncbi:MAG TPA: hypothetical protein VFW33_13985 [Gemmataceae bacterium]|nr:hypothetical protein [Gemmataceae bacterium]